MMLLRNKRRRFFSKQSFIKRHSNVVMKTSIIAKCTNATFAATFSVFQTNSTLNTFPMSCWNFLLTIRLRMIEKSYCQRSNLRLEILLPKRIDTHYLFQKIIVEYRLLMNVSTTILQVNPTFEYKVTILLIKSDIVLWRIQIQDVWWKAGVVVVFGWDLGRIECDPFLCWI